jgi:hypothetical protein
MDVEKEYFPCECGGKYRKWGTHTFWNNASKERHRNTNKHYHWLLRHTNEQQEEARTLIQKQFGTAPSKL